MSLGIEVSHRWALSDQVFRTNKDLVTGACECELAVLATSNILSCQYYLHITTA